MKEIFFKINIMKMVNVIMKEENQFLKEFFLWAKKKVKVNYITMVFYIKKEFGIMIYFKAKSNNIMLMVIYNLKGNFKMGNLMVNVKNIIKMVI